MKSKIFLFVGCALFLFAAASVVAEEAKKSDSAESVKEAVAKTAGAEKRAAGTPVALTMEALQELEERKKALDAREKLLNERANALEVQEKVLLEKLRRMEELNKKMAERLDGFKKSHEEKILKLVSMVEKMRPQAAAEYVENLDPNLAVQILARIEVKRAATILNLVDKKKTARLTELYTGYRDSIDLAAEQPVTGKEEATGNNKKM